MAKTSPAQSRTDQEAVRTSLSRCQSWCRWLCPWLALPLVWFLRLVWPPSFVVRHEKLPASALHPPSQVDLRVLHISDLHLSQGRLAMNRLRRVVEIAAESQADLALLTGDYSLPLVAESRAEAVRMLREISQLMPAYACLGNHDYKEDHLQMLDDLAAASVVVLINESRAIEVKGQKLTLVGVGDFWKSDLYPERCLNLPAASGAWETPVLLLVHNPDAILLQLQKYAWSIAFSGHAHGGQLRVPFTNWYPVAPIRHNHLARPGLHDLGNGQTLCESAGVGNFLGLRINSPGDVIILDIEGEAKQIIDPAPPRE